MDEVAEGVFVGTVEDAENVALLRKHDIDVVVSLLHRDLERVPAEVSLVRVPLVDGPQNDPQLFEAAVSHVLSRRTTGDEVLVHCSAGASRSPAVAATAIALDAEMDLEEGFQQVLDRRTDADPHPALIRQAASVYATLQA